MKYLKLINYYYFYLFISILLFLFFYFYITISISKLTAPAPISTIIIFISKTVPHLFLFTILCVFTSLRNNTVLRQP